MRICSLLPGATEVVAALGLADDLVGISHECDYPATIRHKQVMIRPALDLAHACSAEIDRQVRTTASAGQTLYALDERGFAEALPDLVITQDLCHVCAVTPDQVQQAIQALPRPPEVLTLNPTLLADILEDIERIAEATGCADAGRTFANHLRSRLSAIRGTIGVVAHRPRVVCLEWLDPLYAAGHWVPEMVESAGGYDVLGTAGVPSHIVDWQAVIAAQPDVLILMPCGFTIARTSMELDRISSLPGCNTLPAVRQDRVFVVDAAAYFSRPGPRLVDGTEILAALFHPHLAKPVSPEHARRVSLTAPRDLGTPS